MPLTKQEKTGYEDLLQFVSALADECDDTFKWIENNNKPNLGPHGITCLMMEGMIALSKKHPNLFDKFIKVIKEQNNIL
jgi:hypothetical protein